MKKLWKTRQFGLRSRIIAAFTLLSVLVIGGTSAAVAFTVQRWIYSNAQSMAVSEFKTEMAQLDNTSVRTLADLRSRLSPDVTAIAGTDLINLGTAKLDDIDPGFAEEVITTGSRSRSVVDEVVHEQVGINRVLIGRTITINVEGEPNQIQVYSIRPLPGVKTKITELATVITASFIVGTAVCIAVGAWFATLLVRPLKRLDAAAKQAADGDSTVRLPTGGITELAQLTASFNYMVAQHGISVDRLRRFVADVSHELRTPLAALVPMAEILKEDSADLPGDSAVAARVVADEITKLARLVEDLMEISRHDVRGAQLNLADVDVTALVTETLSTRGWTDSVSVRAPESIMVRLDRRRIEVVMANLVGNALRHGTPPVGVTITATPDSIAINVHDHGAGIPEHHLARIFDRFYKADTARTRSEGSGLGLSLALENVNLHGGTILVSSGPDSTTFTVVLPRPVTQP